MTFDNLGATMWVDVFSDAVSKVTVGLEGCSSGFGDGTTCFKSVLGVSGVTWIGLGIWGLGGFIEVFEVPLGLALLDFDFAGGLVSVVVG